MDGPAQLYDWIERAKSRGAAPALLTLLDALEPAAPIVASGLWMTQPLARLWSGGDLWRELAHALEAPDSLAELRRQLDEE